MATQEAARIVKTEDVLGGKPRVKGRRISVLYLRERVEGAGEHPADVAEAHELDVADVYAALAYYHDNPEEMASLEEQREATIEEHRASPAVATSPDDLTNGG